MLQISQLEDFFGDEEEYFFAYGSERIGIDDFDLDFEGKMNAIRTTLVNKTWCFTVVLPSKDKTLKCDGGFLSCLRWVP